MHLCFMFMWLFDRRYHAPVAVVGRSVYFTNKAFDRGARTSMFQDSRVESPRTGWIMNLVFIWRDPFDRRRSHLWQFMVSGQKNKYYTITQIEYPPPWAALKFGVTFDEFCADFTVSVKRRVRLRRLASLPASLESALCEPLCRPEPRAWSSGTMHLRQEQTGMERRGKQIGPDIDSYDSYFILGTDSCRQTDAEL
jgi:hypothetical protein